MDSSNNLLAALSLWVADSAWQAMTTPGAFDVPSVEGEEAPDVEGEDVAVLVLLGTAAHSIKALAGATDRSHSATVRAVDRLTRAGLVSRGDSATDSRVVLVSLTPRGQRWREQALVRRAGVAERATAALDAGQRAALDALLRQMLEAVTTTPGTAVRICRLCDEDSCLPRGCPVEARYQRLSAATTAAAPVITGGHG